MEHAAEVGLVDSSADALKLMRGIGQGGIHLASQAANETCGSFAGKLQQRIHSNGMALALSRHGYQAIRRINQFSYDKEILYGCPWLFKEQQRLHVQLQACPAEIHGNVAAVLHATLHQMVCAAPLIEPHLSIL